MTTVGKGKGERVAVVGGETGRRAMLLLSPLATTTTTSGLHVTGSVKSTVHQPNTRLRQESECLHTYIRTYICTCVTSLWHF